MKNFHYIFHQVVENINNAPLKSCCRIAQAKWYPTICESTIRKIENGLLLILRSYQNFKVN